MGAAAAVIVLLGIWLHTGRVWITIQTEDQRTIADGLAREGNDLAEQYQMVLKF
jgi:hypothetical protein